jgi:AraC-like DNA-binding protein
VRYPRTVRLCTDLKEFLADPVGRCIAGPCWLYYYPRIDLCGFALWGRPDVQAMASLVRVLRVELGAPPHASLVEVSALEAVEAATFDTLGEYVATNHAELSRAVRRLALVPPKGGVVRAVVRGFFDAASAPYPVESFDTPERALAWLGIDDEAQSVVQAIAHESERAMGPALVRGLRAWLMTHVREASLERAAQALGVSVRSLQRRLRDEDTSFQQELKQAQLQVAQQMLRETDAAITTIAVDLGFSPAHFSALFRSATGLSPSAWRERFRR